jgi:hypothetical protein
MQGFADTEKPYNFALLFFRKEVLIPENRKKFLIKIEESLGEILKRPTRTDCKSVDLCLHRFESCSPHGEFKIPNLKFKMATSPQNFES